MFCFTVPKLPIYTAAFLGSTGNVVVSGRRSFFYVYDAVSGGLTYVPKIVGREEKSLEKFAASPDGRTVAFCGNDGYVILFDAQRKHWITDLKMNGSVRAISFTPDGQQVLGSGSDGEVYRWDLRHTLNPYCVDRFANEDGTITSSLAVSSRHLAVGAESGVVNLYSEHRYRQEMTSTPSNDGLGLSFRQQKPPRQFRTRHREPLKSIMNVRTSADALRFNGDGQILAVSSRRENHALKLVHTVTGTVFANWPTSKTPLGYVWSMDFSPESRYFAVGNDKGNCLLYRLAHYEEND